MFAGIRCCGYTPTLDVDLATARTIGVDASATSTRSSASALTRHSPAYDEQLADLPKIASIHISYANETLAARHTPSMQKAAANIRHALEQTRSGGFSPSVRQRLHDRHADLDVAIQARNAIASDNDSAIRGAIASISERLQAGSAKPGITSATETTLRSVYHELLVAGAKCALRSGNTTHVREAITQLSNELHGATEPTALNVDTRAALRKAHLELLLSTAASALEKHDAKQALAAMDSIATTLKHAQGVDTGDKSTELLLHGWLEKLNHVISVPVYKYASSAPSLSRSSSMPADGGRSPDPKMTPRLIQWAQGVQRSNHYRRAAGGMRFSLDSRNAAIENTLPRISSTSETDSVFLGSPSSENLHKADLVG